MRMCIFGPKMVHLPQTKIFWKIIKITLIYLLDPFIVQNQRIQSYEDMQFLGTKWSISPDQNFFQKTC